MQRARRLASIAVIAVLGTTALSACRSDSSVAAYVGDRKITENEVTSLVDDAKSKVPPGATSPLAGQPMQPTDVRVPKRSEVVSMLVVREICRQLAADKGFTPGQTPPLDQYAQQTGLPSGSRYVQAAAELDACRGAIPAGTPVTPTAEDLQQILALGRAAGVISTEARDDEAASRLNMEAIGGGLALRNTLISAAEDYNVTVNPKYRPLEYPLFFFQGIDPAILLPLGEGDQDIVVDPR